jgi:transcriptional regulator with XRE-family HTH domain
MLISVEKSASINFQKRLKELRLACRWTQEKAAESCGIGYKLFQLYELGIKTNPGLRTLEKIAKGFGLEIHELLAPVPMLRPRASRLAVPRKEKSTRRKSRKKS